MQWSRTASLTALSSSFSSSSSLLFVSHLVPLVPPLVAASPFHTYTPIDHPSYRFSWTGIIYSVAATCVVRGRVNAIGVVREFSRREVTVF